MNDGGKFEALEKRIAALETAVMGKGRRIETDLILPEADIGGLHFNKQEVHAVFEKQADGWYHSRDVLFLSARNVKDDSSRDILTEYLNWDGIEGSIKEQIAKDELTRSENVEISLPNENEGSKNYNGVDCGYWLSGRSSGLAALFYRVFGGGGVDISGVTAVSGCAPMFRIRA